MSYNIWWVEFLGADRTHKAIFLESGIDGEGTLYSVQGKILNGMAYKPKAFSRLESSPSFVSKYMIGTVAWANVPKIDEICRSFPPPGPQMTLGGIQRDPNVPLYRCREWSVDVRSALLSRGVIQWDIRLDTTSQKYYQYKLATGETTWIREDHDQAGQVMYFNQYDGTISSQKPTGKHETFYKLKLVFDRYYRAVSSCR